jgi:hypothetical protein
MTSGKKKDIMRRILAAGYLPEIDSELRQSLPNVTIENNPMESFAFEYNGAMAVILELRITSDREVRMQDFGDLEFQGRPCNVVWLETEKDIYRFRRGPQYDRVDVLNHRLGAVVKPGFPLEGVLLGWSTTRIPSQFSHGLTLPLTLSILDAFDTVHTAELVVQVDETLWSKPREVRHGSLYAPLPGKKSDPAGGVEHVGRLDTEGPDVSPAQALPVRPH